MSKYEYENENEDEPEYEGYSDILFKLENEIDKYYLYINKSWDIIQKYKNNYDDILRKMTYHDFTNFMLSSNNIMSKLIWAKSYFSKLKNSP